MGLRMKQERPLKALEMNMFWMIFPDVASLAMPFYP
jgi:hypothetical protein